MTADSDRQIRDLLETRTRAFGHVRSGVCLGDGCALTSPSCAARSPATPSPSAYAG